MKAEFTTLLSIYRSSGGHECQSCVAKLFFRDIKIFDITVITRVREDDYSEVKSDDKHRQVLFSSYPRSFLGSSIAPSINRNSVRSLGCLDHDRNKKTNQPLPDRAKSCEPDKRKSTASLRNGFRLTRAVEGTRNAVCEVSQPFRRLEVARDFRKTPSVLFCCLTPYSGTFVAQVASRCTPSVETNVNLSRTYDGGSRIQGDTDSCLPWAPCGKSWYTEFRIEIPSQLGFQRRRSYFALNMISTTSNDIPVEPPTLTQVLPSHSSHSEKRKLSGYPRFQVWGDPVTCDPKRRVIAVHGWQDNANSFDPLMLDKEHGFHRFLNDGLCVASLDFSGHGLSSHLAPGSCFPLLLVQVFFKATRK